MTSEGTFVDEAALRVSELLDYTINNSQGENIGEVDDLIVGMNTGRASYAALSFGGFADIGDELYVVPLSALNFDTINREEGAFVFDIDEATLQNAPSLDANNWPDMTAPGWDAEFLNYWSQADLGTTAPVTAEMVPTAIDEPAMRASELIGYNVVNSAGEDLGEVEDLLVNLTNGQVHYAIMSFGGFADIGENLYAIPLSALNFNTTDGAIVFDVDEAMLADAPSFDETTWPDMTLPEWDRDIYDYWQTRGVTMPEAELLDETATVDRSAMRASELIGYNVVNSAGDDLGEIEDMMIGLDSQQVNYAVLSFGGFLDIGEKLFAIPVTALRLDPEQEAVVFDVDEETLANAPGFDENSWPDTANPQWDLDTRDYWQSR
jgi:sporulation protein YlmC with PRC-barrel domain